MEGVEVLVEHLAGRAEGVGLVEVEDVADAVEHEGRDLALAGPRCGGGGVGGGHGQAPFAAAGEAPLAVGQQLLEGQGELLAGRGGQPVGRPHGVPHHLDGDAVHAVELAQARGDGVGHRRHERAPAGGEHEVHAHVRAVHVDVLHHAHVHDADAAVGAAGVVDVAQGVDHPLAIECGRRGHGTSSSGWSGDRGRWRRGSRWCGWRARDRRAARGWPAGPTRGPGTSRRARRASRRRRGRRPPTPTRCPRAAARRRARRRPGGRPRGRSSRRRPRRRRTGRDRTRRPTATAARRARGPRPPTRRRGQPHAAAQPRRAQRAEGLGGGVGDTRGRVIGQRLGAQPGLEGGVERPARLAGEGRERALVTGKRPSSTPGMRASRSSPGSPSV